MPSLPLLCICVLERETGLEPATLCLGRTPVPVRIQAPGLSHCLEPRTGRAQPYATFATAGESEKATDARRVRRVPRDFEG
jgi:hypothetical protein